MSYQQQQQQYGNNHGGHDQGGQPPPNSSLTPSRPAPPIPRPSQPHLHSSSQYNPTGPPALAPTLSHHAAAPTHYSSASSPSPSSFTPGNTPYNPSTPSYVPRVGLGSSQTIVRRGWVSVKEDGLRAWIWSKRWLVLREQTLSFHKSEVSLTLHC